MSGDRTVIFSIDSAALTDRFMSLERRRPRPGDEQTLRGVRWTRQPDGTWARER